MVELDGSQPREAEPNPEAKPLLAKPTSRSSTNSTINIAKEEIKPVTIPQENNAVDCEDGV